MSRIIRRPEVLRLTGLKKSQLDVAIKDGRFPKSFPILEGGRAQGWLESEIFGYIDSRRQARDAAVAAGPTPPVEKPMMPPRAAAKAVKVPAKRSTLKRKRRVR
jgi:prophage regulatory protein